MLTANARNQPDNSVHFLFQFSSSGLTCDREKIKLVAIKSFQLLLLWSFSAVLNTPSDEHLINKGVEIIVGELIMAVTLIITILLNNITVLTIFQYYSVNKFLIY